MPYDWSELFNFFPFMVTFTLATWSTNNSLRLVRNISNLCPYMARLTPHVFNGLTTHSRKPQWKMHKLAFFFIYYKTFINTKLCLPSSSQILAKISICSDYNPFQALFLFNSSDISQVYTMRESANWSLLACGVLLYTIPWRHMVTYWICSLSWLVKLKARPGLKFQLRLRLRFRWNEDFRMNENQHMNHRWPKRNMREFVWEK